MKKFLVILLVILLLLVGAVLVLPIFFKDDVIKYIKNDALNATLEFNEDIELSIFSSFPDITLGIKDVKVINKAPFEGDTLISFTSFRATVDLWAAIGGEYVVKSVDLSNPRINVQVRADGKANYDIAPISDEETQENVESPVEETTDDSYELKLEHFVIENADIRYYDSSLTTYAHLKKFDFSLNGVFDPNNMDVNTLMSVASTTVEFDDIEYLKNANIKFDAGYAINLEESKYSIKENELSINDVVLAFDGMVAMPTDNIDMDLSFGLKRTNFKDLLSLVPAVYSKDYDGLKANGNFEFSGTAKGLYTETSYPSYDITFGIDNGSFQYPDLPSSLNKVDMKTRVYAKEGDLDNLMIDLSKLHFELDQEPFDAKVFVSTPISDPNIDANLKGKIMLERVKNLIPIEGVTKLAGLVDADVSVAGKMSDIDAERYEEFKALGHIELTDIAYAADDLAEPIGVSKGKLEFSPSHAAVPFFDMSLGKSDLSMVGRIENYMAYVLRDDTLRGELTLNSSYLNIDPWMLEEESTDETANETTTTEATSEEAVVAVPGNIDFVVKSSMKEVHYDTYDLKNFIGDITVRNSVMTFDQIALEMMGGKMQMDGFYDTRNIDKPISSFAFQMSGVSIPGAYGTFNTVKELMPIASKIEGNMDGKIAFASQLDNEYMPVYNTLNGGGKISIARAILNGNNVWNKIVETLKWDEGKKRLVLLNIKPSFGIENGRLVLAPLDFEVAGVNCNLSGSNGIDQTMDYNLITEIPAGQIKEAAAGFVNKLAGKELNLPLGETIRVQLSITGTYDNPKITPKFIGTGGEGKSLKDIAKDEFNKKKEEVKKEVVKKTKAELRAQAAKLKEQATGLRTKAESLKDEAAKLSNEGEKLKKESMVLRAEADKKKKEVEQQMKNLPKPVKDKAMEVADKIYDKANAKMDEANKYFDLAKKPEQEANRLLKKADDLEKQGDELLKEE